MSFFVAQGTADLKQMIEMFEQLAYTRIDHESRKILRFIKRVFRELQNFIEGYYDIKKNKIQDDADKPEEELGELEEEKEEVLDDLEGAYYKLLWRFLICNSPDLQKHDYSFEEVKEDLKDEVVPILPFDSETSEGILEDIIEEVEADVFGYRAKGKLPKEQEGEGFDDICGNSAQQIMETE